jgi:antitoxin (DNA-binding transcriptional repressor) of toxin-antitoxin stability system
MKRAKAVSSRDFKQQFSRVADSLKPGESITVTKHGDPIGVFSKTAKPRPAPDYLANLQKPRHSVADGQKVIDAICDLS